MRVEVIYISRSKKINDLKEKFISLVKEREMYSEGLELDSLRIWKLTSHTSMDNLKKAFIEKAKEIRESDTQFTCGDLTYLEYNPNCGLEDLEVADNDFCVIEYATPSSPWVFEVKKMESKEGACEWCNYRKTLRYFCQCKEVWYCREECLERDKNLHSNRCKKRFEVEENNIKKSEKSKNGLVGLQNLGNTCFMNTSLQCISNCYELTEYFLKDFYKKDINVDNPIGTQGVLAKAYANFLKNVWYGESGVFSPWNFKKAIATFQSMFSGYQQHDTQEFLNYLLDGLHEDLNRVNKKPMVEKDDSNKEDSIKSKEQWIGFLRRNQSALVDILYGQYKSTLFCPNGECQNVSTTFDPFLSISLPLVAKTETYEIVCFFIFYDLKIRPMQLNLPFSMETNIMALRNKIAKILNIHPYSFFVVKMDRQGNYDYLVNSTQLIKTNSYFQYENQKPFFLFQIDPETFYTKYNKFCLENESLVKLNRDFNNIFEEMKTREEDNNKLFSDDYEEDENGATSEALCYYSKMTINIPSGKKVLTTRVNVDDNYGFDNNFLKTICYLKKHDEVAKNDTGRTRIIFPRILYLDKTMTTRQTHFYVFKYFASLIRIHHKLDENEWPDDKLWMKFFDNYDADLENDSREYQKKNLWPYRLRIVNLNDTKNSTCYFCERTNCQDCLLPYSENIKLSDVTSKIPQNEGADIDNTYLYLNRQRYGNQTNRDFQIEATWLPEYYDTVHNLNDKRDYDFKILRSAKLKSVSIYDCFKNFVKLEKLEENNEWYCPECKKHQKATKKMEIYKAPHILIVHLKRFRNNSKIDTVVDFPINELDISQYVMSNEENLPLKYDLFAIANHYGSMGFGHYIAFGKNHFDNNWYEFDDSHVSRKSESELVNSSAYVLFYRRREIENLNYEEIYNQQFVNYEEAFSEEQKKKSQSKPSEEAKTSGGDSEMTDCNALTQAKNATTSDEMMDEDKN